MENYNSGAFNNLNRSSLNWSAVEEIYDANQLTKQHFHKRGESDIRLELPKIK